MYLLLQTNLCLVSSSNLPSVHVMVLCAGRHSYLQFCFCFVCQPASCFFGAGGEAQQGEGVGDVKGVGVGSPLFVTKKCVGGALR